MDVSPSGAGTIRLDGSYSDDFIEQVVYPTPANDPISCFKINETITLTAKSASGYQFQYWNFNYWPKDLNESSDKTSNPLSFKNTFLKDDGYADEYADIRTITAYFTRSTVAPLTPENVAATDGTETGKINITWDSAPGAAYYVIYWADSPLGVKSWLAQTTANSYEDTRVIGDTVYYYWVRAINPYGKSPYSISDSGYAYVDPLAQKPSPVYESEDITPTDAKQMLDTDPEVIVVDVSEPADFDTNHILCAKNITWNDLFEKLNYIIIANYKDYPVLVYDQDEFSSDSAADYLAANGFSSVYHLTGGIQAWMANGFVTVDSDLVCACSLPPMALAGQDIYEVEEEQTVYLNGTDSKPADGSSLTAYEWKQYKGTTVDIINADSAEAIITLPNLTGNDEQMIFLLTVTDSQNKKDTDCVVVDVKWENDPPVADAGSFQSVPEDKTVILNGSESKDTDDGIATYLWKNISGPEVTLQDSTKETAWFKAPDIDTDEAELIFELTVTDKGGLSDKARVNIMVTHNNVPPTADAGPDQTVSETHPVLLDGSKSYDPDDGIATYAWTQIGNGPSIKLSNHSEMQPSFTAPEVTSGTIALQFELTVTDHSGALKTDQVTISVSDLGSPPVADAGTDQNPVYEGWQVFLDGSGSIDSDGQIQSYQWTQINTDSGPEISIIGADSATPKFTVPAIDEESVQLIIQLTVADDTGLNGTDQVKIVISKSTASPTANAGDDQKIREGDTVLLDGSLSSDPDDGISEYFWQQTGGDLVVDLSDSSIVNPEFVAPDVSEETVLTFTLTVTDYSETQDTDEVQIRIQPKSSSSSSCFISTLNI